jgi:hypothetical protein
MVMPTGSNNKIVILSASEQASNKAAAVLSDSKPTTHLPLGRTIVLAPGWSSCLLMYDFLQAFVVCFYSVLNVAGK